MAIIQTLLLILPFILHQIECSCKGGSVPIQGNCYAFPKQSHIKFVQNNQLQQPTKEGTIDKFNDAAEICEKISFATPTNFSGFENVDAIDLNQLPNGKEWKLAHVGDKATLDGLLLFFYAHSRSRQGAMAYVDASDDVKTQFGRKVLYGFNTGTTGCVLWADAAPRNVSGLYMVDGTQPNSDLTTKVRYAICMYEELVDCKYLANNPEKKCKAIPISATGKMVCKINESYAEIFGDKEGVPCQNQTKYNHTKFKRETITDCPEYRWNECDTDCIWDEWVMVMPRDCSKCKPNVPAVFMRNKRQEEFGEKFKMSCMNNTMRAPCKPCSAANDRRGSMSVVMVLGVISVIYAG